MSEPMIPNLSRGAPPVVKPVRVGGVRYEQALNDEPGETPGGYINAFDELTGARLWRAIVYPTPVPQPEVAHLGIGHSYFSSMTLEPDGSALRVVTENGGIYLMSLATRMSEQVGGWPQQSELATTGWVRPPELPSIADLPPPSHTFDFRCWLSHQWERLGSAIRRIIGF